MMIFPTFLTLANLFCGFSSLLLVSASHFESAVWIILLASFFDSIDGKVARAYGQSSNFGLQFDSLADVVSFGVAPSFLIYHYYFTSFPLFGILLSFLPLLSVALRLARFNIMENSSQKTPGFIGLASPMGAIAIVSFVFLHLKTDWGFIKFSLILIVPIVCLLMISTIKYAGFPLISWKSSRKNKINLILFILFLILFPFYPSYILTIFIMIYLLSGPLEYLFSTLHPVVLGPQESKNLY